MFGGGLPATVCPLFLHRLTLRLGILNFCLCVCTVSLGPICYTAPEAAPVNFLIKESVKTNQQDFPVRLSIGKMSKSISDLTLHEKVELLNNVFRLNPECYDPSWKLVAYLNDVDRIKITHSTSVEKNKLIMLLDLKLPIELASSILW